MSQRADFLRTHGYLELDYRQPRYPRQGGFVRADVSHYEDRTTGSYTFNRYDFDVRQFVGFSPAVACLDSAGFVSTTDERAARRRAVLRHAVRSAATTRCADSGCIGSAVRTRSCSRASIAGRSGPGSRRRFFSDAGKVALTRADLNFNVARTRLRLRIPLQHRQRRRRPRGRRRSAAATVSICTWSSVAFSKRAGARRGSRGSRARSVRRSQAQVARFAAWRRHRGCSVLATSAAQPRFFPDDPIWIDDDKRARRVEGRRGRRHERLRLRRQHVLQPGERATCTR